VVGDDSSCAATTTQKDRGDVFPGYRVHHEAIVGHGTHLLEEMKTGMSWMLPGWRSRHRLSASPVAARYSGNTVDDGCSLKMYLCTFSLKERILSPSDVRICHAMYCATAVPAEELPLADQGL